MEAQLHPAERTRQQRFLIQQRNVTGDFRCADKHIQRIVVAQNGRIGSEPQLHINQGCRLERVWQS